MHSLVMFVSVVHVVLCVLIVLAVLVQSGKGAEISASFGGSSQTVFGSSGGANFFTTFTGVCAAMFMVTSVFLATQGGSHFANKSLMEGALPQTVPTQTAPVAAAPAKPDEKAVIPPKPETQAHAPDTATKNAIMPAAPVVPKK